VLNCLEGASRPAPVIGVVAGSRIDIPLHGTRTSEAANPGQGLTRVSRCIPAWQCSPFRDRLRERAILEFAGHFPHMRGGSMAKCRDGLVPLCFARAT
jgi:hypothetical protein